MDPDAYAAVRKQFSKISNYLSNMYLQNVREKLIQVLITLKIVTVSFKFQVLYLVLSKFCYEA